VKFFGVKLSFRIDVNLLILQGPLSQASINCLSPAQSAPPLAGSGKLQIRDRVRIPKVQLSEQGLQGPHRFHPPSGN
jgi:hypothetical protein